MKLELTLTVELEGDYVPGTEATRSKECPMGYPGDPPDVINLQVILGKTNITEELSSSLLTELKEDYLYALQQQM
jgi:hypothetical protein